MGVVNLFADTTYEGGSSIHGPFLATLGAALNTALDETGATIGPILMTVVLLGAGPTGRDTRCS
jgi:hypothetical protein